MNNKFVVKSIKRVKKDKFIVKVNLVSDYDVVSFWMERLRQNGTTSITIQEMYDAIHGFEMVYQDGKLIPQENDIKYDQKLEDKIRNTKRGLEVNKAEVDEFIHLHQEEVKEVIRSKNTSTFVENLNFENVFYEEVPIQTIYFSINGESFELGLYEGIMGLRPSNIYHNHDSIHSCDICGLHNNISDKLEEHKIEVLTKLKDHPSIRLELLLS